MAEIIDVFGGPSPDQPVEDLVLIAEDLLAKAKSGKLRGIAYAAAYEQVGESVVYYSPGKLHALGGFVLALSHQMANEIADTCVEHAVTA